MFTVTTFDEIKILRQTDQQKIENNTLTVQTVCMLLTLK